VDITFSFRTLSTEVQLGVCLQAKVLSSGRETNSSFAALSIFFNDFVYEVGHVANRQGDQTERHAALAYL
jgi:hypothetical protein